MFTITYYNYDAIKRYTEFLKSEDEGKFKVVQYAKQEVYAGHKHSGFVEFRNVFSNTKFRIGIETELTNYASLTREFTRFYFQPPLDILLLPEGVCNIVREYAASNYDPPYKKRRRCTRLHEQGPIQVDHY
jgi:hypothetical protein